MNIRWLTAALLFAFCLALSCVAGAHEDSPDPHAGHAMHAPRPQLAIGAAFAPDGRLWVVGLNEKLQLFVQSAPAQALTQWSSPRILDTGADAISADGENRPKIAFGPHHWVVISYTQPLSKPYTGFIRMLRSTDGGQTFSAPFTVHHDQQEITHRFESIAFDASGALHTLWIDKRDLPPRDSGQVYPGAAVYRNVSLDGGATFGPDIKVADHSCECCRIAVALDAQGQLQALWRHVFDEQTRDHAFAHVTTHQPNEITRASYDDWHINACPHHGPGLASDIVRGQQRGYHAVWFGIRQVQGESVAAVRYGRLTTSGEPVADTVQALPDPRAEHADVAAFQENVAVVWRSTDGATTTLKAWLSHDGGRHFELKVLSQVDGYNDQPHFAQAGARMVVVWRALDGVQVHELAF